MLFVNAVTLCPRGQPPSPLGISLLRAIRTTSVLTLWDRLPCPSPPLPSHSSLGDVRTHTSYLSCVFYFLMFRVAHWLGIFTSGRGGGWFLGGGQRRAGNAWREMGAGVTRTPALSRNSCCSPIPGSHPHPPKRWPLFTVRTRSLCLCFLKYKS